MASHAAPLGPLKFPSHFHFRLIARPHVKSIEAPRARQTNRTHAKMTGTRGPVPVPLETQGRNLTQDVLDLLDTKETLQSNEDFPAIPQKDIKAALDRLASRSMVEYKTNDKEQVNLTPESEGIVAHGSHEFKVWKAVKEAGKIAIKELPVGSMLQCGL